MGQYEQSAQSMTHIRVRGEIQTVIERPTRTTNNQLRQQHVNNIFINILTCLCLIVCCLNIRNSNSLKLILKNGIYLKELFPNVSQ